MNLSNVKLAVGVPLTFPYVMAPFFDSFVLAMCQAIGAGININFIRQGNGPLEELRNEIVKSAIVSGCSHVIQVDADMTYPPDTFVRLVNQVSLDRPVVGALCFRRYPPFTPLLFKGDIGTYEQIEEWEEGEMIEVDATGTGCLCTHISVFDKVPQPWFKFKRLEDNKVVGEDIGFCSDLRHAGVQIFVDSSLEVGHLSIMEINHGMYDFYKLVLEGRKKKGIEEE